MKKYFILLLIGFLILVSLGEGAAQEETPLGMAGEFTGPAACA